MATANPLQTHELCYTYIRATLGVSYASPAYYADRLCDRGRAYIRDFIVGSREMRDQLNEAKRVWASGYAALRKKMFPDEIDDTSSSEAGEVDAKGKGKAIAPASAGKKTRRQKTKDEQWFDVVQRDLIDKKCREWVLQKISDGGSGWKLDQNPWHDKPGRDDVLDVTVRCESTLFPCSLSLIGYTALLRSIDVLYHSHQISIG